LIFYLFWKYILAFLHPAFIRIGTKFCTENRESRGTQTQPADYTDLCLVQNLGPLIG
jgi:hypothetical protein